VAVPQIVALVTVVRFYPLAKSFLTCGTFAIFHFLCKHFARSFFFLAQGDCETTVGFLFLWTSVSPSALGTGTRFVSMYHLVQPKPMSKIVREHTYSSAQWEATAGYSRAVRMGPFIYVAGTTATDPVTGQITAPTDVYAQSVQIWENISAALGRLGASLKDVVRTRMFVVDILTNGSKVAEAHAKYFKDVRPASTMLGIPGLYTADMLVEFGAYLCFSYFKFPVGI
jgi:enamine deaminase RidA (YjgF/YER057c/UK114 family)